MPSTPFSGVGQEHRLRLVGAFGGALLGLGLLERLRQPLRALAHTLFEHRLLRLQRFGGEHVVVHVVESADQDGGVAFGVGPDPYAAAEPAVVAEARADAGLALRVAERRGRVGIGLFEQRQVVGMDARTHRLLQVRQFVVGKAEHLLVARRVPGLLRPEIAFPDPLVEALEQPAVALFGRFEQAARGRFGL
jgi:hypothetical protein